MLQHWCVRLMCIVCVRFKRALTSPCARRMAAPVVIKRVVSIECGEKQSPWLIDTREHVDGKEFLKLAHRDSGFCRFVAGTRARFVRNTRFLHELQLRRSQLTIAACEDASQGETLFDEVVTTATARKKARSSAKTKASLGEMRHTVNIDMPSFTTSDNITIPATTLHVKSALDVREAIMMEIDPHMLHYVRHAMLNSIISDRAAPDRRHDGVRWRGERGCWLAKRADVDGKVVSKSFKPHGDDELAMRDAADRASAWAAGQDDDEPCEGTDNCDDTHVADESQEQCASTSDAAASGGDPARCHDQCDLANLLSGVADVQNE